MTGRNIIEDHVEAHPSHSREYNATHICFPDNTARVTHHNENQDLTIALIDTAREARWLGWPRTVARMRKRPQYRVFLTWWKARSAT